MWPPITEANIFEYLLNNLLKRLISLLVFNNKKTAKQNLCLLSIYPRIYVSWRAAQEGFVISRNLALNFVHLYRPPAFLLDWIMLTASKFCFAALLAAFLCQTQARHDRDVESEDFRNFTRRSWNCKVIDSGSFKQTKTIFAKSKCGWRRPKQTNEKRNFEVCVAAG